jgi:hypothetical protein
MRRRWLKAPRCASPGAACGANTRQDVRCHLRTTLPARPRRSALAQMPALRVVRVHRVRRDALPSAESRDTQRASKTHDAARENIQSRHSTPKSALREMRVPDPTTTPHQNRFNQVPTAQVGLMCSRLAIAEREGSIGKGVSRDHSAAQGRAHAAAPGWGCHTSQHATTVGAASRSRNSEKQPLRVARAVMFGPFGIRSTESIRSSSGENA